MQAVLSKDDFQSARTFLRWTGMGVQPSAKRAQNVLELLRGTRNEVLAPVEAVVEDIGRGVMVSQATCNTAQEQLLRAYPAASEDIQTQSDRQNG
jgi:hypothetical protein